MGLNSLHSRNSGKKSETRSETLCPLLFCRTDITPYSKETSTVSPEIDGLPNAVFSHRCWQME